MRDMFMKKRRETLMEHVRAGPHAIFFRNLSACVFVGLQLHYLYAPKYVRLDRLHTGEDTSFAVKDETKSDSNTAVCFGLSLDTHTPMHTPTHTFRSLSKVCVQHTP